MLTAEDLRLALVRADPRLSKYNPLPRILAFDDFNQGPNGWCELCGNHDGNLVLEVSGQHVGLTIRAQVSPDGLFWCGEGAGLNLGWRLPSPGGPPVPPGSPNLSEPPSLEPGLHSFALTNFGAWLRLRCQLHGTDPSVKILVYLALKE